MFGKWRKVALNFFEIVKNSRYEEGDGVDVEEDDPEGAEEAEGAEDGHGLLKIKYPLTTIWQKSLIYTVVAPMKNDIMSVTEVTVMEGPKYKIN